MPRPFDWHLVGLAGDPTPGDAFGIRSLAREYGRIAEAAADAEDIVRRARRSHGSSSWIGLAGDVFREKSEGLPGELASAAESYAAAEQALKTWADRLDDAQAQADRGLQQAREAHGELAAARAAIGSASWSLTAAQAQVLQYETLERLEATIGLPPGVSAPTPYQVRSADRAVQQAQQSLQSAQAAESAAQSRLDAARALVLEAKTARDEAESTTVQAIATAGDSAVKPSSIWEAITSSQAWQVVVTIATVVVTVVGIIAIFIGGPIVWALLLAATALLLLNALMQIAQGKDAWFELATLAIGLIPGGALLAAGGRIVTGISRLGAFGARIASTIGAVTNVVRAGTAFVARVGTAIAAGVSAAIGRVQRIVASLARSGDDAVRLGDLDRGVMFFDEDIALQIAKSPNPTIGISGRPTFLMPEADAIRIADPIDAMVQTGLAPSVTHATMAGEPVYFLNVSLDGLNPVLPRVEHAMGNVNFLPGGHTAVKVDGEFIVNATREMVVTGGAPVQVGDFLGRILPSGVMQIVKSW